MEVEVHRMNSGLMVDALIGPLEMEAHRVPRLAY